MSGDLRAVRRIFGPPGTGKTTELARRVGATVAERGGARIRIGSFSKTAAAEIASRDEVRQALPEGAVGTMHHHAYEAIGRPEVAFGDEMIKEWNGQVGPTWQVTGKRSTGLGFESRDRVGGGERDLSSGDGLLEYLDLLRCTRVHPSQWPTSVQQFASRWQAWKRDAGCVDFADMIVGALKAAQTDPMPGEPELIVVDEAQDMTRLEIDLALAWGAHLDPDQGHHLVFALDDDQAIMEWRGGDPQRILGLDLVETDEHRQSEVLSQSHRVPPAVHAVAEQWIERCGSRWPKAYAPRNPTDHDMTAADAHGSVQREPFALDDPRLLDAIEADLADPAADNGLPCTSMVIAPCGYMLDPLIAGLRERGIPFHNPFRLSEAGWNPLGRPGRGKSTAQRIYRYALVNGADPSIADRARRWTGEDVRMWLEIVNSKVACLSRGVKRDLANLPDGEVPEGLIVNLWPDTDAGNDALARATSGDLDWLASVITDAARARAAAFPIEVAKRRGAAAIADPPRVVVGTIHSTKGAQASRVYLAPDLSAAGFRQWGEHGGRDQVTRLMYVGATRAYHHLSVLTPTSRSAVHPGELVPPGLEVRR